MKNKFLFIIRGLPGSGKTTAADALAKYPGDVYSADDYFMTTGKYLWDPKKIGAAHNWCKQNVETAMLLCNEKIFVANTSTTKKEMDPYYKLAEKHGYMVFSLIAENRHNGMNVHNVPAGTLKKMADRFEVKL